MSPENGGGPANLAWPPLIKGTLLKRYKRFLADMRLESGEIVTAHCPNSGRMTSCCEPGRPVYVSKSDNPKRKLKYTWEMIHMPGSLVGVNTQVPNRLVAAALAAQKVKPLAGYETVRREVRVEGGSRIDLMLSARGRRDCLVEVKNCTLVEDGVACFPDAVTARGFKHLSTLQNMHKQGLRCAMFFLVQRMDAKSFSPADRIDPAYGKKLREVMESGVEVFAYDALITLEHIRVNNPVPFGF